MLMYDIVALSAITVILGLASEALARGAEELEKGLSQGIVGGLVLGLLTSLPETVFVVVALLNEKFSVALGSAIGGNVVLFTFGVGLVGLAYFWKWRTKLRMVGDYKVENRFLLLTTLSLAGVIAYGRLNMWDAIPLLLIYSGYVGYRLRAGEKRSSEGEVNKRKAVLYLLLGAATIVALSDLFVNYLYDTAVVLGVPPVWLSLVLTPIASEMEEKVSAIRLATSHAEGGSLAIVSFIGSKIENATVLLALIGIFTDFDLHPALPEVISALIANVIGVVTLLDGKLGAKESVMLIVLYFAMIYFSFLYY